MLGTVLIQVQILTRYKCNKNYAKKILKEAHLNTNILSNKQGQTVITMELICNAISMNKLHDKMDREQTFNIINICKFSP